MSFSSLTPADQTTSFCIPSKFWGEISLQIVDVLSTSHSRGPRLEVAFEDGFLDRTLEEQLVCLLNGVHSTFVIGVSLN